MPSTNLTMRSPMIRLLLAGVCGTAAMVLLHAHEEKVLSERSGGPRIQVLVARAELHAGERLQAQGLGLQEIPRAYVHSDAILAQDQDKIVGRKVYRTVRQNQALLWDELDAPALERSLGVQKGLRATPIPLGDALAKTRLLSPGDYIDILAHVNQSNPGGTTITLLQRVQVLELLAGSAMVAMTPEQLETLVLARATGTITLALRGREDLEEQSLPQRSWQELLNRRNQNDGSDTVGPMRRTAGKARGHEDRAHPDSPVDPR